MDSGKQQRKCPHCERYFSKTEHLARHIRSHTKEKPFKCTQCGRSYSRHDSLLRHSRVGHARGQAAIPSSSLEMRYLGDTEAENAQHAHSTTGSSCSAEQLSASSSRGQREPSNSVIDAFMSQQTVHPWHEASVEFELFNLPANTFSTLADSELMDVGLNPHEPAWMLESDFDFGSLNFSISNPSTEGDQPNLRSDSPPFREPLGFETAPAIAPAVQYNWYTTLGRDVRCDSPDRLRDRDSIDEALQQNLTRKLQLSLTNTALPSADFLNLCIKLYFVKFNPVFPLIHPPSFRPSSENALLLLSMCSVGALFIGSDVAASQGRHIYKLLNKYILSSWDKYIRRSNRQVRYLLQAAIIGQTFGMLSGQPSDVYMTESFHGTVISWARHGGLFKSRIFQESVTEDSLANKEELWKKWVHLEELARLVLGLHVHDSESAVTFHHEPLLRHTPDKLPICSSEDLFFAPNATEWYRIMEQTGGKGSSVFEQDVLSPRLYPSGLAVKKSYMHIYASLAAIVASIQEQKSSSLDEEMIQVFRDLLLSWYNENVQHIQECKTNFLNLMIYWHASFIALYADADMLERSVGRDGRLVATQSRKEIDVWASSSGARRSLFHAFLILKHLQMLPIGAEPAIHVPKAVFYAGMVLYSFMKFTSRAEPYSPSQDETNIPELQPSGSVEHLEPSDNASQGVVFPPVDSSALCNLIDLLRRIGHWEISSKFCSILKILLDDLTSSSPGI